MDDIVERLRNHTEGNDMVTHEVVNEAADEIERLRAELADWQRTVRAHEEESLRLRARVSDLERENEFLRRQEASRG